MCVIVRFCIVAEFFVVFFFQAEDGIRDAQESRGLGDVYKRQDGGCTPEPRSGGNRRHGGKRRNLVPR